MGMQTDLGADAGVDELEAKKQRKAAKRAAKEAAAAAEAEEAEAEAKRQRKAAKKAAKEAAEAMEAVAARMAAARSSSRKEKRDAGAGIAVEAEETPKAKKSKKEEVVAEEPKAKKSKKVEAVAEDAKEVVGAKNDRKVFIKGLPYSAKSDAVRRDFGECGEITEFKLPLNDEGKPKGFAFIQFATQEGFEAALKFDKTDYGGRYLNVAKVADRDAAHKGKTKEGDWTCPSCSELVFASKANCRKCGSAKPGAGSDNDNTVFVRGLPWSVEEEALRTHFGTCGEIERLSLPKNDQGKPKGISFIRYKLQEGVDAALKFDNTEYDGRTIFVSVAGEAPKGKGKEGKDKGKGEGKGKDGKGKDGKGKSKGKGKAFVPTAAFANKMGCIVEGMGEKKTFADSDDE